MADRINCSCCDQPLAVQWSDTHGIAACTTCGMPYRLYHYENDKRVDKTPECTILPAWQAVGRSYWDECKMRVFPAEHDVGVPASGRSYSGATLEEHRAFWKWVDEHKDEMPKAVAA